MSENDFCHYHYINITIMFFYDLVMSLFVL